jgi:hypothetical protein
MKDLMKESDIAAREMGDTKIRGVHVNRSINVLSLSPILRIEIVAKV